MDLCCFNIRYELEVKGKDITKHSTFRLKEKQEERGSVQTLWAM